MKRTKIAEKMEELEKKVNKLEENTNEVLTYLKIGEDGKRVICLKCQYSWKTTSELKLISCPNCGSKIRNETIEERKKRIEERKKKHPDYKEEHDLETVMEEINFN